MTKLDKYECDCGRVYTHVDQLHACASNNHYEPVENQHVVKEIVLSLINENTEAFPYNYRKDLGYAAHFNRQPRSNARAWTQLAAAYVRHYEKEYPGIQVAVPDILKIALALCEYYTRHAKETIDAYQADNKKGTIQ